MFQGTVLRIRKVNPLKPLPYKEMVQRAILDIKFQQEIIGKLIGNMLTDNHLQIVCIDNDTVKYVSSAFDKHRQGM